MKHDWEYKKIKDVCTKGSSNLQQNKIVELTGDYPVFGASGFVQNIDTYQQERPYIGIVKDGSGVGRVNTYPAKSSLLGTMQYIIPNNNINLGYVAYCLQSLKLSKFASGAAIPHIYFRDYGETYIPVPPLPVQEDICSLLDKMNRVIEAKKEQLKELDNLAQAIFYDMFGDPITNNKGWNVAKVIDVVKLQRGYDLPVQDRHSEGNIPIYGANGIVGYHTEAKAQYGIITGRSGSIGDVYMSKIPFWPLNTSLFSVDTHDNDIVFLMYLIRNYDLLRFKQGAGVPTLNRNSFHQNDIIDVPLHLQQAFAEKVQAIERQKELINQSIKDVQTLFDAKMDYYFGD